MPRPWWTFEQELKAYLNELTLGGRSPATIHNYDWALRNMFKGLEGAGYTLNPRKIGRKEVDFIRYQHFAGRSEYYAVHQLKRLMMFCKWAGNTDLAKMCFGWGDQSPTNIRWLDEGQAALIRANADGHARMIVHCELDLGMRRIEVLRLKVSSFQRGRINKVMIHGKGRNGGKWRSINWHPDTGKILEDYIRYVRNPLIQRAREINPRVKVPDELLIYLSESKGELRPYQKTAVDEFLKELGREVGIDFSNHDLRRTCGRMMYRAGVRLEVIARIFGHSDTRTTIRYLGLDFEDMSEAMQAYAEYQKGPVPKMVQIPDSQKKSGRAGIFAHKGDWPSPVLYRSKDKDLRHLFER